MCVRAGTGHIPTWRIVLSIMGSVIGAILIFCLCLSCLGHRQPVLQQTAYPMQAMPNSAVYGYPPQGVPMQNSVDPAVYGYPPQNPAMYSSKVPGPSGTV